MIFSIYGLYDPSDSGHVRYVGYTGRSLVDRLLEHIKGTLSSRNSHRLSWLRKVLLEGRAPKIFLINETSTEENAHILEKLYIREHKRAGHKLTNLTDGGDGGDTFSRKSKEEKEKTRVKMCTASKNRKGWKHTIETCARISAGNKKARQDPGVRAKMSIAAKGKNPSVETRTKLSIAAKGRKLSEETCAKMSAGLKKSWQDPKVRIKRLQGVLARLESNL